jgi:hypothetical protein
VTCSSPFHLFDSGPASNPAILLNDFFNGVVYDVLNPLVTDYSTVWALS